MVVLVPDRKVGFAQQMNSEDYPVLRGVMNELLDHYLGLPERDWVAAFGEWNDKRLAGGVAALDAATAGEHGHTTPLVPLARYAGRYADSWYGPIAITHDEIGRASCRERVCQYV